MAHPGKEKGGNDAAGRPPAGMPLAGRPQKRSLTLHGHRTSVSLEPAFWEAFLQMARDRGMAINALAAEVDALRVGGDQGLATAIRLAVLDHVQGRLQRAEAQIHQTQSAGTQSAGPQSAGPS